MKLFPQSLRWTLQLWHGLLLFLVVTGLLAAFYSVEREQAWIRLDRQLQRWSPRISDAFHQQRARAFNSSPDSWKTNWLQELDLQADLAPFFEPEGDTKAYYAIWDPRGNILTFSASAPFPIPFPRRDRSSSRLRTRDNHREFHHILPEGTTVLVGLPLAPHETRFQSLGLKLIGIGTSVLALSLLGGWWIISRSLRPIAHISSTAQAISQGKLQERIPIKVTESELGQLSQTLNDTFRQLENAFAQQVRFTGDASHELRTPISIIRSKTQLTLSRDRSVAEYREALELCQRNAERMGDLVESLLELARIDSGEARITPTNFDLIQVAKAARELVLPLANESEIKIQLPQGSCAVLGVPGWTQQVISNLLINAIRYCPGSHSITMTLEENKATAALHVVDAGPGIPPEDLEHIFERFFRVDKARARNQGGSGLGLAICKALMEAQNGAIKGKSEWGKGSQFTLRLPLCDPPREEKTTS